MRRVVRIKSGVRLYSVVLRCFPIPILFELFEYLEVLGYNVVTNNETEVQKNYTARSRSLMLPLYYSCTSVHIPAS